MTPAFSIVTPVYDPPLDALADTIDSVLAQTYRDWELVLVNDNSAREDVAPYLDQRAAADPRIRVIHRSTNGHISRATNDGIAFSRGEFVALLDHDDLLDPRALEVVAREIAVYDDVDFAYTDEDKTADGSTFFGAFNKPDWSPTRLRGHMYCGHLSIIRRTVLITLGGLREGYEGSQDHDLVMRVGEVARRVLHVPDVLHHWRIVEGSAAGDVDAKPYAWDAGVRALQSHADRVGLPAKAVRSRLPSTYQLEYELDPATLVSVVVTTDGWSAVVGGERRYGFVELIRSVLARSNHPALEIVLVHGPATPQEALDQAGEAGGNQLRMVAATGGDGESARRNIGLLTATGSLVVFVAEVLTVSTDRWLAGLLGPLAEDAVGMTGPKLLSPDGSTLSSGLTRQQGAYLPALRGAFADDPGPYYALMVSRECSALPAQCVALRRRTALDVGGWNEECSVDEAAVDLAGKVQLSGRRVVWVEPVVLELAPGAEVSAEPVESELLVRRWGVALREAYL